MIINCIRHLIIYNILNYQEKHKEVQKKLQTFFRFKIR